MVGGAAGTRWSRRSADARSWRQAAIVRSVVRRATTAPSASHRWRVHADWPFSTSAVPSSVSHSFVIASVLHYGASCRINLAAPSFRQLQDLGRHRAIGIAGRPASLPLGPVRGSSGDSGSGFRLKGSGESTGPGCLVNHSRHFGLLTRMVTHVDGDLRDGVLFVLAAGGSLVLAWRVAEMVIPHASDYRLSFQVVQSV